MPSLHAYLLTLPLIFHFSSCCLPPLTTTTRSPASTGAPTFSPIPSSHCKCGERKVVRERIVGGQNAQRYEYPWQVALVWNYGYDVFCGGSLLSSRTVLTAAHCQQNPEDFMVVVGLYDTSDPGSAQRIQPKAWASHENYNSRTTDNDFAIITLAEDVVFSNSTSPVCLPSSKDNNYSNMVTTVTGWGTLESGGNQPDVLQEVDVRTMTKARCTRPPHAYSSSDITDNMICAAALGKDSCQGDSGGPLVGLKGTSYDLVGVVSWGFGCAQARYPGVYSRVTAKLDWIKNKVEGKICDRA